MACMVSIACDRLVPEIETTAARRPGIEMQ